MSYIYNKRRRRRGGGKAFNRVTERLPDDDKTRSIFDTISSQDLKAAMEKAWNSPKVNNARFKARWKP